MGNLVIYLICDCGRNGVHLDDITQEEFMKKHHIKSAEFFSDFKQHVMTKGFLHKTGKYKIFRLDNKLYIGATGLDKDSLSSIVNDRGSYNSNLILTIDKAQLLAKYSGAKLPGKQKIYLPKSIDNFCRIMMGRFHLTYKKDSENYKFIGFHSGSKVKEAEKYLTNAKIPYRIENTMSQFGWGKPDQYEINQTIVINCLDLASRIPA